MLYASTIRQYHAVCIYLQQENLTGSIPLDTVYSVCEELRINLDKSLIQVMLNLTGSIPLDTVYSVCEELRINLDKSLIQVMLVTLGLINKNNFVDYTTFTQLLNWRHNFPPINIPTKYLNYESSYTSACNDRKSIDNSKDAPCGVSSMSRNLSHSTRGFKSDLENLGNETNVMALINPSIYEQYGINHRHFFMERGKPHSGWAESCASNKVGLSCMCARAEGRLLYK
ncbi:unnamed protein product [Timema podura]|uniref:Uncharacterized protein n=1 Tax=Timema podura TaxID=61482 RepID=A0ABN7NS81_TIMPD|nr:unnamed protein product [Timema podura]